MKNILIFILLVTFVLLFSSQARPTLQEVRVSTNRNSTLINGFRSNAANYEIVNLPQDAYSSQKWTVNVKHLNRSVKYLNRKMETLEQ